MHSQRTHLVLLCDEFDLRLQRFAECRHDV
jgi:hypothetical protein